MSVLDTIGTTTSTQTISFILAEEEGDSPKEARIAQCSTHYHRQIKATTGTWRAILNRCGVVRECPICREIKVTQVRESFIDLSCRETARVVEMSNEDAARFCRRLGSENYRRLPTEEGCTIVFVNDSQDGDLFDKKKLLAMDWDVLAIPPEGKRTTGKLGLKVASSKGVKVKVANISAPTATEEQWQQAAKNTARLTSTFNPKTLEEVGIAVDKRAGIMTDQLRKMGVNHTVRLVNESFQLEDVNWQAGSPIMESNMEGNHL